MRGLLRSNLAVYSADVARNLITDRRSMFRDAKNSLVIIQKSHKGS